MAKRIYLTWTEQQLASYEPDEEDIKTNREMDVQNLMTANAGDFPLDENARQQIQEKASRRKKGSQPS